jgi:hypothetical protein
MHVLKHLTIGTGLPNYGFISRPIDIFMNKCDALYLTMVPFAGSVEDVSLRILLFL